jgi:hypothetical protein
MDRCLNAYREFYQSLKIYPAIPEGTRDPYLPPTTTGRSSRVDKSIHPADYPSQNEPERN